jgi:hypothetical protein
VTVRSALIWVAVVAVVFGLVAWRMTRRKGVPAAGLTTVLGIAGVFTGFYGVMENRRWLYIPCGTLIVASYAIHWAAWRRSARGDELAGAPGQRPPGSAASR